MSGRNVQPGHREEQHQWLQGSARVDVKQSNKDNLSFLLYFQGRRNYMFQPMVLWPIIAGRAQVKVIGSKCRAKCCFIDTLIPHSFVLQALFSGSDQHGATSGLWAVSRRLLMRSSQWDTLFMPPRTAFTRGGPAVSELPCGFCLHLGFSL